MIGIFYYVHKHASLRVAFFQYAPAFSRQKDPETLKNIIKLYGRGDPKTFNEKESQDLALAKYNFKQSEQNDRSYGAMRSMLVKSIVAEMKDPTKN